MCSRTNYGFLISLIVVALATTATADKDPQLRINIHLLSWGSTCDRGFAKVIAGSKLFVSLENDADQPPHALASGWPEGYVLEAALDPAETGQFISTPGAIEQFQPTRYISGINRHYEGRIQGKISGRPDLRALNSKEFVLSVPSGLIGHTFTLRATYDLNGMYLVSDSTSPAITVVAPCSKEDTARVEASRIYAAWQAADFARATEIADSMLEVGLTDAAGWWWAKGAAVAIYEYDKALAYLDRMYQDFGVLSVETSTDNPPLPDRATTRDPALESFYQNQRDKLLQVKAEHEQQER